MLGPILFLICINDLDNNISSDVLKFADDTKIYRTVTNQKRWTKTTELDTVGAWAVRWQMKFNVVKLKYYIMEGTALVVSTTCIDNH